MSSFGAYMIGILILIIGIAATAYLLNVPTPWIAVGVIMLIGLGVMVATNRTAKDARAAGDARDTRDTHEVRDGSDPKH